jgi:hypothetical protein
VRFCCVSPSFWVIYWFLEDCYLQIAINLCTVIFTIRTSRIRTKIFTFRNFTPTQGWCNSSAMNLATIGPRLWGFIVVVDMNIVRFAMMNNRVGFYHYDNKLLFIFKIWQDYVWWLIEKDITLLVLT